MKQRLRKFYNLDSRNMFVLLLREFDLNSIDHFSGCDVHYIVN